MNIIKKEVSSELVIKKSKFVCFLYKVQTEEEIKKILNNLKLKYKDADHHCYAYVLKNKQKYDEDKEPNGTVIPLLENLLINDLVNTLVVVIRYFGGIKLGVGGLSRAYSLIVKETLLKAKKEKYIEYEIIKIESSFDHIKQLDYLLKNYEIIDKSYNESVTYRIKVNKEKSEEIKKMLSDYKII